MEYYTAADRQKIDKKIKVMHDLAEDRLQPRNKEEKQFVQVAKGIVAPKSEYELAYVRWMADAKPEATAAKRYLASLREKHIKAEGQARLSDRASVVPVKQRPHDRVPIKPIQQDAATVVKGAFLRKI